MQKKNAKKSYQKRKESSKEKSHNKREYWWENVSSPRPLIYIIVAIAIAWDILFTPKTTNKGINRPIWIKHVWKIKDGILSLSLSLCLLFHSWRKLMEKQRILLTVWFCTCVCMYVCVISALQREREKKKRVPSVFLVVCEVICN